MFVFSTTITLWWPWTIVFFTVIRSLSTFWKWHNINLCQLNENELAYGRPWVWCLARRLSFGLLNKTKHRIDCVDRQLCTILSSVTLQLNIIILKSSHHCTGLFFYVFTWSTKQDIRTIAITSQNSESLLPTLPVGNFNSWWVGFTINSAIKNSHTAKRSFG